MSLSVIRHFLTKNSSVILLGVAISGVVTTSVLAADGHIKAQEKRYEIVKDDKVKTMTNAIKARWIDYVPAIICGGVTIGAIIWGARISNKKIAAIGAAYTASKDAYSAYRKSVKEQIEDSKVLQKIDDGALQKQQNQSTAQPVFIGEGTQLCFDVYSGRYFASDRETIRGVVNDINAELLANDRCSLNEYYERLGLETVDIGSQLGWNVEHLIEVEFGSTLRPEDGKASLAVKLTPDPSPSWYSLH